jgi:hypothetical protein
LGNFWQGTSNRFQNLDFLWFACDVQVSKLDFFRGFPQFLGDQKKSLNAHFSVVARDFEGQARPKNSLRFSRNEQVSKFGFSCGFPQFLGDLKISQNSDFSSVSQCFEGRAPPNIFSELGLLRSSLGILKGQTHPKK